MGTTPAAKFDSKALRVNLELTQVRDIEFNERYHILLKAVEDYVGVKEAARHLLLEIHHPFKNWNVIISEFRAFSLKNMEIYARSPHAVQSFEVFLELYLALIDQAPKAHQRKQAVDACLAYFEKFFSTLDTPLISNLVPAVERAFSALKMEGPEIARYMAQSLHPLPRSVGTMIHRLKEEHQGQAFPESFIRVAIDLIGWIRRCAYEMWLTSADPLSWFKASIEKYDISIVETEFEDIKGLFYPISHDSLRERLDEIFFLCQKAPKDLSTLERLISIPGNIEIVRQYRVIAQSLKRHGELGLRFLFYIMELPGLAIIYEETIRGINRILIEYIKSADTAQLKQMLPKDFELLEQHVGKFPQTALQCIEALGTEILKLDDPHIQELFLDNVIGFGFQTPNVTGVDMEWHILRNPAHLPNIRVWMKLIGIKPYECSKLLSALLINIKLGGICIKDTDLFQKDVSRLLNSNIRPVYNLVKQLAKQFPVYFNEIGAEGLLRDVSTELDEITHRQDRLIHFLRKQSHVESNNLIVDFIEAILCFWYSKEKEVLRPYLPDELLEELPTHGEFVDPVHRLISFVSEALGPEPSNKMVSRLVKVNENALKRLLIRAPDVPPRDKDRFLLLIKMYRLETLKYKLGPQEILHHLEEAKSYGFEGLDEVIRAVKVNDPEKCLDAILKHLELLKEIILSPEEYEIQEDIYFKRHIAADIPSMYGRYHERKFDALSLTFRLENLANTYFERLITGFDVQFITYEKLRLILNYLILLWRGVKLDGIQSKKFETYLRLLEQALEFRQFSFAQFRDIVHGLLEGVKDIIYIYYIHPHQENLPRIVDQLHPSRLIERFRRLQSEVSNKGELINQLSERFLRDLIARTFGLQYLDNFITRIHHIFEEEREALSEKNLDLLLTYSPDHAICPIETPNPATKNLIHLGNKGFNLIMLREEGMPVPPGLIITTELYRCREILDDFPRVLGELKERIKDALHPIEDATGRRFGHPKAPLLLSVRSGAAISMPGMMSTIINVGSNIDTIEGLAHKTENMWFAWDNYRRFIQSWAMGFGLSRDVFTGLMAEHKKRHCVDKKRQFSGEQMRELALRYREETLNHGIKIIDDPWEQLMCTIRLVLNSWESQKAIAYRQIMDLSDKWGTAVIVQVMTFGNMSINSGTGVVFTTNPNHRLERVCLWGDYTPGNQGEDIVSGLVSTYPISREQKEYLKIEDPCLEEQFPEIYNALLNYIKYLVVDRGWTHQEIEFTFETPNPKDLYILQSRDMTPRRKRSYPLFDKTEGLRKAFLGRGIGVSGGALSGRIAFTHEDILKLKDQHPGEPVILVRSDTVPDDIKEISLADGLLTAKGGQTSHAAIVALRLEKTCVVGFKGLKLYEQRKTAIIDAKELRPGEFISIDGRNGAVYSGQHKSHY